MVTTYDVPSTTSTDLDAPHAPRGLGVLLAGGGLIGLVAAFVLTWDKLELLKNPDFVPSCDFGAVLSCTNIMKSDQAAVFGFPNPLLGLIGFSIVITLGVLLLAAVDFPEWVWAGLQAGVVFGIGFVTWLQWQSLYEIGSLCPWCMVVWSVTFPIFFYVTVRNLRAWFPGNRVVEFLRDWHVLIVGLWFVTIGSLIFFRFYA